MPAIVEVDAADVPTGQVRALKHFAQDLEASPLRNLLDALIASIEGGFDVSLLDHDFDLTPNQVATQLRMSRTFLYKLLDSGALPSHRVGRDRRVRAHDVVVFERQRQSDRAELAQRLAHTDETRAHAIDDL